MIIYVRLWVNVFQDSESKTLVSKLESSAEGEYLGVVMESKLSHAG